MKKFVSFFLLFFSILFVQAENKLIQDETQLEKNIDLNKHAKIETKKTYHEIKINDEKLKYCATAGLIEIEDKKEKVSADIFYVAYDLDVEDKNERPVTFVFNGGPGSSSVWLHFGAVGPKRILLNDDGTVPPLTPELVDNDYTWLKFTDLVFIDPVGTGYSQSTSEEKEKDNYFYDFKKDIESVGDFIRLYLTKNKRWMSDKFIAGESYGGIRGVELAKYTGEEFGIGLNGLILISPALSYEVFYYNSLNNVLPFILSFPSYAIAAKKHNCLSEELNSMPLNDFVKEVEEFAQNEYALFLLKGNVLSKEDKDLFLEKFKKYSGLSEDLIKLNNFKIYPDEFFVELLKNKQERIGRFDSSISGVNFTKEFVDPSDFGMETIFARVANSYFQEELEFNCDDPYKIFSRDVIHNWTYDSGLNEYSMINVTGSLQEIMNINKYLKVFVPCGYFDLAVPYFSNKYFSSHLYLDESIKQNLSMEFYEGGHMMYTRKNVIGKFTQDIETFYEQTLN